MTATWMGWLLGAVLGMRHALEPDHLAAGSTLVADVRDRKLSMWLGAFWGVGHWLGLLLLGGALAAAQAQLPERTANLLEIGVAWPPDPHGRWRESRRARPRCEDATAFDTARGQRLA